MKIRFVVLTSLLILNCQAAFASNISSNKWLAGFGGGGAIRGLSSSTSVSNGTPIPAPFNTDIYSISTSNPAAVIDLFGGYQWDRSTFYLPYYNVTLHYQHQFDADVSGNVQQYAVPMFTNYHYYMSLTSDILGVIGKVGLVKYKCLVPYFSAGAGVAFNQVNNYFEAPIGLGNNVRVSPNYGNNNNTNFAYTLGAGVDIACCKNAVLSLAYEYWNLGKVNTSSGSESWSGTRLNFGTLQSNTLLATITYFLA